MPIIVNNTLNLIRSMAMGGDDRAAKAKRLAELVQTLGSYRWVGVYDVGPEQVSIIAWSGPNAPEFPTFPVTKGLTGAAIQDEESRNRRRRAQRSALPHGLRQHALRNHRPGSFTRRPRPRHR